MREPLRPPLDSDFAQLLRSPQGTVPLCGLEHEYYLDFNGQERDFRRFLHHRAVDGRRLDPGDINAYRLRSGLALTCDDSEAEIASPPVPLRAGFATEIGRWANHGAAALRRVLPPGVAMSGASTHVSVSAPEALQDDACLLYARRFAPALMLLAEGPDSHGIMIRPRPGRIELCTEFNAGSRLEQLVVFAAGSVAACVEAARTGSAARLPDPVAVRLEGCPDRPGVQVRREAFGADLLAEGRATPLQADGGELVLAGDHFQAAWGAARPQVSGLVGRGVLGSLDALAHGASSLPATVLRGAPGESREAAPVSLFGRVVDPFRCGGILLTPIAATWDFSLFRFERPGRQAYAAIPRASLGPFLRGRAGHRMERILESFLEGAPRGRRLECYCQLAAPGLWDEVGPLAQLLTPERFTFDAGVAGGAEDATSRRALVAASSARAAKGDSPRTPPPPPPAGELPRRPPGTPPGTGVPPPPGPGVPTPPPVPPPPVSPPGPARPWKRPPPTATSTGRPGETHEHTGPVSERMIRDTGSGRIPAWVVVGGGIAITAVVAIGLFLWAVRGQGEPPASDVPPPGERAPGGGLQTPTSGVVGTPGGQPTEGTPARPRETAGPAASVTPGTAPSPTEPAIVPSPSEPGGGPVTPVATSGSTSPTTRSGGGETPAVPPTPMPTPTPTPPPVLSGYRSTTLAVASNPANHPCVVGPNIEIRFFVTRDRAVEPNPVAFTITGPGLPTMSGSTVIGPTFDSQGGTGTASGTGTYCNYTTTWEMEFKISSGGVSGTLTIGGDGALPSGKPIVFTFTGGAPH